MFNIKRKEIGKFLFFGMLLVCSLISKEACANPVNDYIYHCGFCPANEEVRQCVISSKLDQFRYPQDFSYDGGRPSMVIIHETANPRSTIENEITFMTRNQKNAFVHSFTDANRVITVANPNYKAWGCGANGNRYGIQIENIEVHSKDDFAKELANCAGYTAKYLLKYGLGSPKLITSKTRPFGGGNLASHSMISRIMGGTTHSDPDGYWADRAGRFFGTGYNMNDFRDLVQYFYDRGNLFSIPPHQRFMRAKRPTSKRDVNGRITEANIPTTYQKEFVDKF
ncbi:MAG: N-acetylmuramoyl-L-alanine amidase, partial [Lactobacillales bacterium]|nr:N-acetylmuramoyl-L-alanine amidase [Lactobacillales bacterium]